MMNTIPDNWVLVALKDVVRHTKGKKPNTLNPSPDKGLIPYIDIKAFESNQVRKYADIKSANVIKERDILIVWDGARSGLVGQGQSGAIGSTIMALTPIYVNSKYLFRFLQSQYDYINSNPRGTGIPHVDPNIFWNINFPIAPSREQERIVAKLEKLLAKVDKCKERLAKIPLLLKRFRQAVLSAAYCGSLTADWRLQNPDVETASELLNNAKAEQKKRYNENCIMAKKEGKTKPKKPAILGINQYRQFETIESWIQLKLDYAFLPGNIFDGPFGSNLKTSDYTINGVRVIRLENIGFLSFIENKKTFIGREKYTSLLKHTVNEGDIIFASFISDNVRVVVLPAIETSIAKADCFCLRPIQELLDSKYLAFILSSSQVYDKFNSFIHGATRPRINTSQLKNIEIPLPPIEEQKEIVRRVESLFALADQIEARYQNARTHVDHLAQSILAKAFRGELVPQDPSDPPASELLKQIQAEREKQQPGSRKAGKRGFAHQRRARPKA